MLIDTHAHIYLKEFDADREAVIERAFQRLSHILMPNIDAGSIDGLRRTADLAPGRCLPMMGLHPCSVDANYTQELGKIETELARGGYCAVGEAGLDYYWDTSHKRQQQEALRAQLEWARDLGLPIALHTRESFADTLRLVEAAQDGCLRGVFHCFGGTAEEARQARAVGFHLGIGGVLTYKKSGLADVLRETGLDGVILETDSPYLPPTPHRGKRNEPAYVALVAEFLAQALGLPLAEVEAKTTAAAAELFGIKIED